MRFISGFQAAAIAGALILLPGAQLAQAGGFDGGHGGGGFGAGHGGFGRGGFGVGHRGAPGPLPGYGANAYAPGQGNTGAAGWNGGNWRGFTKGPFGYFGGGGYGGGYGGEGVAIVPGPSANVFNNYTYNDYRRRDGGFYGGGGVFYGDDGYSRLYSIRPPGDYSEPTYGPTGYAPHSVYRPSQHIFYLPDNNPRAARKAARHTAEY